MTSPHPVEFDTVRAAHAAVDEARRGVARARHALYQARQVLQAAHDLAANIERLALEMTEGGGPADPSQYLAQGRRAGLSCENSA
jgi:hypothetical protein